MGRKKYYWVAINKTTVSGPVLRPSATAPIVKPIPEQLLGFEVLEDARRFVDFANDNPYKTVGKIMWCQVNPRLSEPPTHDQTTWSFKDFELRIETVWLDDATMAELWRLAEEVYNESRNVDRMPTVETSQRGETREWGWAGVADPEAKSRDWWWVSLSRVSLPGNKEGIVDDFTHENLLGVRTKEEAKSLAHFLMKNPQDEVHRYFNETLPGLVEAGKVALCRRQSTTGARLKPWPGVPADSL
jgi:hypothetical protein